MVTIKRLDEFQSKCNNFAGIGLMFGAQNTSSDEKLWSHISVYCEEYRFRTSMEDIKNNSAIKATRDAYKLLGKDPNRYRPSPESLARRILKNLPLYKINTIVDILNFVSLDTGVSIGGFDLDKIVGTELLLGVGTADDLYEGIGRGLLNIENLPVYRDEVGGIGTPTSDNERTKISLDTKKYLVLLNGYDGALSIKNAENKIKENLTTYIQVTDMAVFRY